MNNGNTSSQPGSPAYDVFLSFAGPDRQASRALREELGGIGLHAFLDEYSIEVGESITHTIVSAMENSKLFVAYYSEYFTTRPACQLELSTVYIAAQQSGTPSDRIMVVNPETTTDHIIPQEFVASAYSLQATNPEGLADAVQEVGNRVNDLASPIGSVSLLRRPDWYGRIPSNKFFTGRYRERWELHTALTSTDETKSAVVVGPPGVGKSTLVGEYAARFGHMFAGGIYWLGKSLHANADSLDEPSLWIFDNAPSDFSSQDMRQIIPSTEQAYTILIKNEDTTDVQLPTVKVGPLSAQESRELLAHYREADSEAEEVALRQLAKKLGYHAGTLFAASQDLRHAQGIISYESYLKECHARLTLPTTVS